MRLEISRRAEKDLSKLEPATRRRIVTELLGLENGIADKDIKKLKGLENHWRFRIGDYRVILTIDQGRLIITALHVAHRREVYR